MPNVRDTPSSLSALETGHGGVLRNGRDHTIQPFLLKFQPGGGLDRDMIGHVGEEFAHVLYGRLELLIDGECHDLIGAETPAW